MAADVAIARHPGRKLATRREAAFALRAGVRRRTESDDRDEPDRSGEFHQSACSKACSTSAEGGELLGSTESSWLT
jgi:hypothetical protein